MEPIRLEMLLRTFKTEFLGYRNEEFLNISTDSRVVTERGIFFALSGERFDGHDFVNQAIDNGNIGVVVNRGRVEYVKSQMGRRFQETTLFAVPDTLRALGDLAAAYLNSKKVTRIAITGSCGKTTTKELLASMLSVNHKTLKTEGNYNNLIGLPLTAFRVDSNIEYAVFEMGMNAFQEIKRLTEIASPNIAMITNVREAHLEGVGSVEGVLDAKWELFENSKEECICVINLDDERIAGRAESLKRKKVTCSKNKDADITLQSEPIIHSDYTDLRLRIGSRSIPIRLKIAGVHNIDNLLLAAAGAHAAGLTIEEIKEGAEAVRPVKGRMNIIRLSSITLIDDTYNANPSSMEGALRFLSSQNAEQRIAVLADMLELGMDSYRLHQRIGEIIATLGNIDALILLGREVVAIRDGAVKSGYAQDRIFMAVNHSDAVSIIKKLAHNQAWVLIKGSHSMNMEKVVEELRAIF
ncbi:MAG: UDP-N-acetylmuramoyl-tripeptide--D-alanyl-D-alanine ligase [Myxococcota bacterium]